MLEIITIATILLVFLLIAICLTYCLLYVIWQLLSVSFVARAFDEAKEARELLRKMGDQNILEFLGPEPDSAKVQILLQLVYAFNRIGAGIQKGYLNQKAIFDLWKPYWFYQKWMDLKALIEQERDRRKTPDLYEHFQWLATIRCPQIVLKKKE